MFMGQHFHHLIMTGKMNQSLGHIKCKITNQGANIKKIIIRYKRHKILGIRTSGKFKGMYNGHLIVSPCLCSVMW